MNAFIARVINHVATEVITKRLAQSAMFQNFALKTHQHIEKGKTVLNDPKLQQELIKNASKISESVQKDKFQQPVRKASDMFALFRRALGEEISKDFKKR